MIHPTAVVHPRARLGAGVSVGPYAVIGEHVEVGEGTSIGSHVVIEGHTRIGRDNKIHAFCALGGPPQDKKYRDEPTRLEIGDRNTIREFCSLNVGTAQGESVTRVGSDNWIMSYVHIAHDCTLESNIVLANSTQIAGHVQIGEWVILGGMTGVHQFCKVGAHSFTGGGTILLQDLPPYVMAHGNPAKPYGINSEGLRRRGFSAASITAIRRAYKTLYRSGLTLEEAKRAIAEQHAGVPEVRPLLEFVSAATRGIIR